MRLPAILSIACLASLASARSVEPSPYRPTALQMKVDRSLSPITFQTPFRQVRHLLRIVAENDCNKEDRCFWADANGVQHYFWAAERSRRLEVKRLRAADFANRAIPALGIGRARGYSEVLLALRRFDPRLTGECDPARMIPTAGPPECTFDLGPGFLSIRFGMDGKLDTILFDASEFE